MSGATDLAALDALIEELTVDAHDDEEQLSGFLSGAVDALVVGEIAAVAGVEVRIVAVDCGPDARRGLIAVCERDGRRFELSLADITLDESSELGQIVAAYRRWLGCDPHPALA
jgi:hypothetical protein